MKFSSSALFAALLIGTAVAQNASSGSETASPSVVNDKKAQRDAEKAQKAADKQASRTEVQASKDALSTDAPVSQIVS